MNNKFTKFLNLNNITLVMVKSAMDEMKDYNTMKLETGYSKILKTFFTSI